MAVKATQQGLRAAGGHGLNLKRLIQGPLQLRKGPLGLVSEQCLQFDLQFAFAQAVPLLK